MSMGCKWLAAALLLVLTCAAAGADRGRVAPSEIVGPPTSELKSPDGSPAAEGSYSAKAPAALLDARGTIALWFKLHATLRKQSADEIPLLRGDALHARIRPRGNSVYVLTDFGPAMTGKDDEGKQSPYRYQSLLTHLKGGDWYHAAWTWDASDARRNNFFLNGIPQYGPSDYEYPGQVVAARGDTAVRVGGDAVTVSALQLYDEPLDESALRAICRAAGREGYADEGVRFSGEKSVPEDVDWDHPVYETSFDDPSVLKDWRLEGGLRMGVSGANLVLENGPPADEPDAKGRHLVCWLTRESPADFLLEFTFRPKHRDRGLAIVFFNARGLNGEGIFEPPIRPRDGTFSQYHSGDVNNYHISYWSGGRGTANLRKNKGFYLVAVGRDLVYAALGDAFQTVRIHKRGGRVRLTVDDVLALAYDDDGKTRGPVHTHSGWIGLRQMAHAERCEYGCLRVYPLKP